VFEQKSMQALSGTFDTNFNVLLQILKRSSPHFIYQLLWLLFSKTGIWRHESLNKTGFIFFTHCAISVEFKQMTPARRNVVQ